VFEIGKHGKGEIELRKYKKDFDPDSFGILHAIPIVLAKGDRLQSATRKWAVSLTTRKLFFPAFVSIIFLQYGCGVCGNIPLSESRSPNGRFKAVITKYTCGISSTESTELWILPIGNGLPTGKGNVLSLDDCNHSIRVPSHSGVIPIQVT
jgi:hypothetical protein